MPDLHADRSELARFIGALFRYTDSDTFASLRAFDQFQRGVAAEFIRSIKINGSLEPLIDAAIKAARDAANADHPVVFAPPVCTFTNPDRARTEDLANGLALSVEIDEGDTHAARQRLEGLLGPPTVVMTSGGEWVDQNTGQIHAKMHLHWRLSEPTRDPEDHERLRSARDMAARLIGADPTGKPVVHPLRWPGSWNTKAAKPVMARIAQLNETAEINLPDALDALSDAIEAAGMAAAELPRSGNPTAPLPLLAAAMATIPNADEHYDTWIRYGYAAFRAAGSEEGRTLWEDWSRKSAKFNATEQDAAWSRIHKAILGSTAPRTIGAGTIFFEASRQGWKRPAPEPPPPETDPGWWHSLEQSLLSGTPSAEVGEPPQTSAATSADGLEGRIIDPTKDWLAPAPLREWIVDGWIPRGYVTGLYGDGGVGKSLLSQQLLTSVALGLPWCGMDVRPGRGVGMMCEDDTKELHRRQEAINRTYRVEMRHLELFRVAARFGFDNLLMTFNERNQGLLTPLFTEFCKFLDTFHPNLVVLDTLADIFGGNEIYRVHARQFVQGVGGQIARQFNCAVVICAHPSAAGISTGSGSGGSTAWSNTFRSRLYLTRPESGATEDTRLLSRMKANFAPKGGEITLRWIEGAFQAEGARREPKPSMQWQDIQTIFAEIERAWQAKEPWSNKPQTKKDGRYLPLWAEVRLGLQRRMVAKFIDDWLAGGFLASQIYDQRNKATGLRVIQWMRPPVENHTNDDNSE